jgi:hypothetical protein
MRKRKMRKLLMVMLMAMLFFAGNAFAIPTDINGNVIANTPGYHWVDAPYWTSTDLTTGSTGSNIYQLQIEYATYESDFGLFIVDDLANGGGTLTTAIKLCKKSGAAKIISCVVHPVLVGNCLERVSAEGEFIATDTIESPISKISVIPALVGFIKGKLI